MVGRAFGPGNPRAPRYWGVAPSLEFGHPGRPDRGHRVGEMLWAGRGTAPDVKQGMEWLTKAAVAGDAFAQFDLSDYT